MKYQRRRVDWARHDKMMLVVTCGGTGMASLSIEKELRLMRHTLSQSHLLFDWYFRVLLFVNLKRFDRLESGFYFCVYICL